MSQTDHETKHEQVTTTWVLDKNADDQLAWDIRHFCENNGLSVKRLDANHLRVTGLLSQHETIHKIEVEKYSNVHHTIISNLPNKINKGILGVLGFNSSPIAKPRLYFPQGVTASSKYLSAFTPLQLARLYNFPTGDGTGQKIGIIELGGGFTNADLVTYLSQLGIVATPNVTAVSVDGAVNNPSDPSGANVEVLLDIEIIMAIVPKAAIRVYFAPNTDQGFYDAILKAYSEGCKIISISWGAAEKYWYPSTLTTYNNLFQILANNGTTVFAAAGDNGSSDGTSGNNVDFPASSPYVVGCGGTRLVSDGTTIAQELVWNNNSFISATGGGISAFFNKPSYQNNVTYSLGGRRGVPDVAGNADPNTGYSVYVQGQNIVVGGTSAVSPLWSGLLARINQNNGNIAGFLQPKIYSLPSVCIDITVGNNGSYQAGTGWDPCTGNGSPNGLLVQSLLATPLAPVAMWSATPVGGAAPLTVQFTDASTGTPTSWLWNFGDGNTSTVQNPSHMYLNPGNYTVTLQVGNSTLTRSGDINVSAPLVPTAYFTAAPLSGKHPLTVSFINNSKNATNYQWTFGDGKTSTLKNPNHIYNSPGVYTISLTAISLAGSAKFVRTRYIFVK